MKSQKKKSLVLLTDGGSNMVITKYDSFAIVPKRCDKCNSLFIFEWYNWYVRYMSPDCAPFTVRICKRCIEEDTN